MPKKGGALNKLPAAASPDAMYYVSAHGLLDKHMFVVPPNTYIIELCPAGFPALKDASVMNWIYAVPGIDWKSKMADKIAAGTFPQRMCHSTVTANAAEAAECSYDSTMSIYEPGDYISNQLLSFKNNSHPLGLLGVWKLPVAMTTYMNLFEYNDNRAEFKSEHVDVPAVGDFDGLDKYFLNKPANMFGAQMFGATPKTFLIEILYDGVIPAGTVEKPNVIVVHACRTAPVYHVPTPYAPRPSLLATRARRLSVSARRRDDTHAFLNRSLLESIAAESLRHGLHVDLAGRLLDQSVISSTDDIYNMLALATITPALQPLLDGRKFVDLDTYTLMKNAASRGGSGNHTRRRRRNRQRRNTVKRSP